MFFGSTLKFQFFVRTLHTMNIHAVTATDIYYIFELEH